MILHLNLSLTSGVIHFVTRQSSPTGTSRGRGVTQRPWEWRVFAVKTSGSSSGWGRRDGWSWSRTGCSTLQTVTSSSMRSALYPAGLSIVYQVTRLPKTTPHHTKYQTTPHHTYWQGINRKQSSSSSYVRDIMLAAFLFWFFCNVIFKWYSEVSALWSIGSNAR